jgi:rod shape-determining protein MreC
VTRLAFFGLLSLALLFADTRFRYLENIRQVMAIALYPLQRAVQLPGDAVAYIGSYFASQRTLAADNAALREHLLLQARAVQKEPLLEEENAQLRALLKMEVRFGSAAVAA